MAKLSVCGLLLGLIGLVGCASPSGGGFGRDNAIHELHLLVLPVPLKSNQPGATSGFAVRVFASSRNHAKGMSIRAGTLDLLGYGGALSESELRTAQPARVWSFPAAGLAANASLSSLGVGYQFALSWDGPPPTQNRLTLVARLTPASGPALYTAPSILPISAQ